MEIPETHSNENDGRDEHGHPRPHKVTVTVDTKEKTVFSGTRVVSDFKAEVGVDPNYVLDEVIRVEFTELVDTAKITIKGGEVFVSHVRRGGSS